MDELFQDNTLPQLNVIGSMLIEPRCVPAVLSALRDEDFSDGTCRATFRTIRKLVLSGKPVDLVLLVDEHGGGEAYVRWLREAMDVTGTAANLDAYITSTRNNAVFQGLRACADKVLACPDLDGVQQIVREMSGLLSATGRMPRMTGAELAKDFLSRMDSKAKPEYLPWGIPSADSAVYAVLGDMILLGGYSSSGKTLLSILMALAQAKRYKVGYYSLETQPGKMADRMFAHLAGISLDKIKNRRFCDNDWDRLAEAANAYASVCPFDIIQASGSTVDDIATDAVAHGYQIIYLDYLQLIEVPAIRAGDSYARVSAVSRGLKMFAQSTNTAVVALAQLSRPESIGKGETKRLVPPSMQSFRDSGQIEQDADAAFLLWPEDPDDNQSTRVLKLAKNKEGRKFKVRLSFSGDTQTMVEIEQSVAAKYAAEGRAIKRRNSVEAQMRLATTQDDGDCPFRGG